MNSMIPSTRVIEEETNMRMFQFFKDGSINEKHFIYELGRTLSLFSQLVG